MRANLERDQGDLVMGSELWDFEPDFAISKQNGFSRSIQEKVLGVGWSGGMVVMFLS